MVAMTATPGLCDGIQVIGAGLGRTGTKSLQAALDILEYNRTYQHFPPPAHAETWARFAEGSASVDEVLDLVVRGGFTATCDQPMADLYAEQLRRFPDAVVVLTVRDSGERWAASWGTLPAMRAARRGGGSERGCQEHGQLQGYGSRQGNSSVSKQQDRRHGCMRRQRACLAVCER